MPDIAALEGDSGFDVTWPWTSGERLEPGLTCVFRVRNEARNLPWVLPPIFSAVDHVLLVDNGSDDDTAGVAQRVAEQCGAADRLTVLDYPHAVARAGGEHLATPATSVHSLTHFYNWCFSHVRTTYSMKWDGDMVLTPEGAGILRDLSWQLQSTRAIVAMPRHPLTVVDESTGWLDLSLRFLEPWVYPMGPDTTFVKAFDWELREQPPGIERIVLQQGLVVEVKWLDADEYAHWRRDGVDFTNTRLYRKLREFEVDEAIRNGDARGARRAGEGDRPTGRPRHRPRQPRLALAPAPSAREALTAHLPQGTGADMSPAAQHPLHDLRMPGPTLVLVDDSDGLALDALHGIEDVPGLDPTIVPLSALDGPRKGWGSVLVVAADRARLRRMASAVPLLGQCKAVACWLTDAPTPWVLVPRPEWPPLAHLVARPAGERGVLTVARFGSGARAQLVVMEMARQAAGPGDTTHGGVVVAYAGRPAAPGLDARSPLLADVADAGEESRDVPPDVVVARREGARLPSTT